MSGEEVFRPGVVTNEALRDLADQACEAAATRDPAAMTFLLGRIAEWALTAARTAEAAADDEGDAA